MEERGKFYDFQSLKVSLIFFVFYDHNVAHNVKNRMKRYEKHNKTRHVTKSMKRYKKYNKRDYATNRVTRCIKCSVTNRVTRNETMRHAMRCTVWHSAWHRLSLCVKKHIMPHYDRQRLFSFLSDTYNTYTSTNKVIICLYLRFKC